MTHSMFRILPAALGLLAVASCAPTPDSGESEITAAVDERRSADALHATPRQLMRGWVMPQYETIERHVSREPIVGVEWEAIRNSATLLHEASHLLMREPPVADEAWVTAATGILRESSADIVRAVGTLDVSAVRDAFRRMSLGCATCHRECTADFIEPEPAPPGDS